MASKIRFDIQASNIGPHTNLNASFETGSLQLGLYANNGSGKTFLSRIFRLVSKTNPSVKDVNKLLTLGQSQGSFRFSVNDIGENKNTLVSSFDISLKKNNLPVINYDRRYIYHVFNDEYIKENLEELKYKPNGNIEGYILGKDKIDISKEREEIQRLSTELEAKDELVINAIDQAKKELELLGIRSNTKELSLLNYENIIQRNSDFSEVDSLDQLKVKLLLLKSAPDNLPELENIKFDVNLNVLFDIQKYLETEHSRSLLADEFKNKVREKQNFIERGLELMNYNETKCPFCEQDLLNNSLKLIDEYNKYLNDSEAKYIREADNYINFLGSLESQINRASTDFSVDALFI